MLHYVGRSTYHRKSKQELKEVWTEPYMFFIGFTAFLLSIGVGLINAKKSFTYSILAHRREHCNYLSACIPAHPPAYCKSFEPTEWCQIIKYSILLDYFMRNQYIKKSLLRMDILNINMRPKFWSPLFVLPPNMISYWQPCPLWMVPLYDIRKPMIMYLARPRDVTLLS